MSLTAAFVDMCVGVGDTNVRTRPREMSPRPHVGVPHKIREIGFQVRRACSASQEVQKPGGVLRASSTLLAFCTLGAALGCERGAAPSEVRESAQKVADAHELAPNGSAQSAATAKLDAGTPAAPEGASAKAAPHCAEEWRRLEALEALPGAPGFESRRVEILGRARAEPVIFERAPGASEAPSPEVLRLRSVLTNEPSPAEGLSRVLSLTKRNLPLRREVLLHDGYLYAEEPALASTLAGSLRLEHLFDEPEIVLERGTVVRHLVRRQGRYFDAPAGGEKIPLNAEEASLLLLDRVTLPDAERTAPLHFSLREVAAQRGASSIAVERITPEGVLVRLGYAGASVRAVLDRDGPATKLRCEEDVAETRAQVEAARAFAERRRTAFSKVRTAIDHMVDEQLPFDEPKTEEGQQDGKLRPAWREAYFNGHKRYEFNGDEYAVFDGLGRPRVPQVCVDFITDVLERASGAWWAPRGKQRSRDPGRISFRKLGIENSRSVESFVDFAWATPEWFDVVFVEPTERVPFRKRKEFFAQLAENPHRYQVGDVIFIYGLRSDDKPHYHSFYVYDADPVSGAPTLLAANAGRPRVRSWEGEMQNAPKRSIVARLRPRIEFLEALLSGDGPALAPTRASLSTAVEPDPGSR